MHMLLRSAHSPRAAATRACVSRPAVASRRFPRASPASAAEWAAANAAALPFCSRQTSANRTQRPASRVVVAPLERGYERLAAPAGVVEPADTFGQRDPKQQRRHRQARPQCGGHLEPGGAPLQASFRSPLEARPGRPARCPPARGRAVPLRPAAPVGGIRAQAQGCHRWKPFGRVGPSWRRHVADVLGKADRLLEQRGGAGVVALEEVSEGSSWVDSTRAQLSPAALRKFPGTLEARAGCGWIHIDLFDVREDRQGASRSGRVGQFLGHVQ